MANELSNLQPAPGSRRPRKRVGRGEGSGKGETAGRGSKGQRARSTVRRGFEGGQMSLARRLPKRGFRNIFSKVYTEVRLDTLAARFEAGDVVDVAALQSKGIIGRPGKDGVKVLGNGSIDFALTIKATKFTKSAAEKIRAAGGTAEEVSVIEAIANILRIPDLRNRIFFTLAMLAIYRLGIFIPAPGVDRVALGEFFAGNQGNLLGLYDLFSGGALSQFSVFVLGIMPYISASIIMQLGQVVVPQVERLKAEGQAGRKKINQYTRYLTIGIAVVQSFMISVSLEQMKTMGGQDIVITAGWSFRLMTMITMTAGSCFVMWLGEQITDRGVGNGASLIITAGIIAGLPSAILQMTQKLEIGEINLLESVLLVAFMVAVIMGIVFIERGQRRLPIQYAKRVVGRKVYGGQSTHLPLKVNVAGVIPPIFASSVMMFPATIGSFYAHPLFEAIAAAFMPGTWTYNLTYVVLIVFFAYFYTAVTFNPVDVADNLRKHGGYVPGIRPGEQTAAYIDRILTRLTAGGSVYLAAVCILPTVLITMYGLPFYFGGTGLLIVVGVSLDTVSQIEGHLLTRHYDGLMGAKAGPARKGRRRPLGSL